MELICDPPNRTLDDYKDQFAAGDLKYKPQINEYEANPHLIASPSFQARRAFEREHGIIPKRSSPSLLRSFVEPAS